jgi:hypothetical protein
LDTALAVHGKSSLFSTLRSEKDEKVCFWDARAAHAWAAANEPKRVLPVATNAVCIVTLPHGAQGQWELEAGADWRRTVAVALNNSVVVRLEVGDLQDRRVSANFAEFDKELHRAFDRKPSALDQSKVVIVYDSDDIIVARQPQE